MSGSKIKKTGCKGCGDPKVAPAYYCSSCEVAKGKFNWCVITQVPRKLDGSDSEGNLFDQIVSPQSDGVNIFVSSDFKLNKKIKSIIDKHSKTTLISFKSPVFTQGDLFPVDGSFGRELISHGRKPSKWDVEYELFPPSQYKKALLRAIKATKEYSEPYDNLKYIEDQARKKGLIS